MGVEFLAVGAYAMAAHGQPRSTGAFDVWVRAARENAERVLRALAAFGTPTGGLRLDDFAESDRVVQLGVSPCRIDLLADIDGVAFEEAWPEREEVPMDGLTVPVLSRGHSSRTSGPPTGRRTGSTSSAWSAASLNGPRGG